MSGTRRSEPHEARLGFPGNDRKVTVAVPDGDIAPWDLDTKHVHVGTTISRLDGIAKVTGRAKYAYDVNRPGMLHGVLVRSPHPSAKLTRLDLEAVRNAPGVRAAVALREVGHELRYAGDPVAAIAADRLDQARDALAAVGADWEILAGAVIDFRDHDAAPELDAGARVRDAWPAQDAEKLEQALAACKATRDETWSCEVQTHTSLETHGMVVEVRDDGSVEVWASTQATFGCQGEIATVLGVPREKVRVHADFVGGGFGSKFQSGDEGRAAALLAREAKRPVKVMLSRHEEHTCAGNRPSALMQIRAGVDDNGTIRAWDYRSWGGPGFVPRGGATKHVTSYLDQAEKRNTQRDLSTNTDAGRAMRAPGWPQGNFAAEGMIDLLAEAAGMDPLAFRLHNDSDVIRQAEWRLGAERFGWEQRHNKTPGEPRAGSDPRFLRGAGMAAAVWGQMGGGGNQVTCRIHQDGTVEARNGAQDIGTGMKTVLAMLTAEELGIDVARVKVTMGDTNDPVGPASGGSTTTPSLAPTARHAASLAREQLEERVAAALGVDAGQVRCAGGRVTTPTGALSFQDACRHVGPNPIEATGRRFRNYEGYQDNVAGCQFAEVEVDTRTGQVRVLEMLGVQDCGLVIATKLAESQVIGAMIQGIGHALFENRIVDRREGRMVNGDMLHYKIPGAADMPKLSAVMFSVKNGKNNVGAAGLGEPPSVAAPAAIANAVSNAIGARMRSLPITPDKVLAALAARAGSRRSR